MRGERGEGEGGERGKRGRVDTQHSCASASLSNGMDGRDWIGVGCREIAVWGGVWREGAGLLNAAQASEGLVFWVFCHQTTKRQRSGNRA